MELETKKTINKISLNALVDLNKKELTTQDKHIIISKLLKQFTQSQIAEMTGIPARTISNWVNPKYNHNSNKQPSYDLDGIIEYFNDFVPKLDEWGKLTKLKKIIDGLLE